MADLSTMEINCHLPITLRIAGRLTDDQLVAVGRALAQAVAARLAETERILGDRYGWCFGESVTVPGGQSPADDADGGSTRPRFVLAALPAKSQPSVVPMGRRTVGRLDAAMTTRQEQRSEAELQVDRTGEPRRATPDPFGAVLREALAEAMRNPSPRLPDPVVPGDRAQQRSTVAELDALAWWRRPQIQDAIPHQAERLAAWQRRRPNRDPTKDVDYYLDEFRTEFVNSMTYILQHRKTRKYKGRSVTVRELRLAELRDAEANLAEPPAQESRGAESRAFAVMGAVVRAEQARQAVSERWQQDIEHAATRFVVLARNKTDFLTIPQHARSVRIFGLPEWLEGTVPASANPDLVEQDAENPGSSPTVIRFLTAVRREYGPRVIAGNYPDHEKGNNFVGDIKGIGLYSFDIGLGAPVNADGFYDHAEAVRFFLALERASAATAIAWIAYYNDFEVAREVNEHIGKVRVGFSGAGTPRNAKPGDEGSLHHGPKPYILHIHVNVMPVSLAGQLFTNRNTADLPSIDLGSAPE